MHPILETAYEEHVRVLSSLAPPLSSVPSLAHGVPDLLFFGTLLNTNMSTASPPTIYRRGKTCS